MEFKRAMEVTVADIFQTCDARHHQGTTATVNSSKHGIEGGQIRQTVELFKQTHHIHDTERHPLAWTGAIVYQIQGGWVTQILSIL